MDTFNILRKMLFNIELDVLTNLVGQEAWGLALWLIQSLDMYNLPYNAKYFLLSAEIYLANKKAIKAYDLLKHQNILCTSRDKWYVTSTINDEHVRSKIMYILLDSFCNEFIDYAFFLFQFLLKDQSSQYNPIDLSCYVDKLIILFLSRKDTNLIIEMANIILKYTFALNTTTCRALISTLIHLDENLARQIYSYAEGIGVYPKMKLWPVTYIIINNDFTEEEIYLTFVQLLRNLIINFGHAIEFAKPHQIKVYLILEVKSINAQFYCAELQNYYNNKAITNIRALIRNVLKKRFDPPILLMSGSKGRIYKLQSTSVMNYLKTEHCN